MHSIVSLFLKGARKNTRIVDMTLAAKGGGMNLSL